jgi:deoxyribodipyrimidine photo-lyase
MLKIDPRRTQPLNQARPGDGAVVYWMSRDQRVDDNWALLYALAEAQARRARLHVAFCLAPRFPGATQRAYDFLFRGLQAVEQELRRRGIGFHLLPGDPAATLPALAAHLQAGTIVADFDPLRVKRAWRDAVASRLKVPLIEVDAHNIVPCRVASDKQEYGAYTLRPKLRRLLDDFLIAIPPLPAVPAAVRTAAVDWPAAEAFVKADAAVAPVQKFEPGAPAAQRVLERFLRERLATYPDRNADPNAAGQSDLSPYLHFGQISAQRVALAVQAHPAPAAAKAAFLEQLIVRRELSDNYCWYNPDYDSLKRLPAWARTTLDQHAADRRPYRYRRAELEAGATHDPLWNAAQREMVAHGKMHNYLRMYWAKKILEWTGSADEAFEIALALNDRYELDGRDPNGFVGVAWAIGGVHDRAWTERPVFGKIRYMNDRGCRRKFDAAAYIRAVTATP